jgi:hypothetical protein
LANSTLSVEEIMPATDNDRSWPAALATSVAELRG